jgi:hypothetical protein
VATWEEWAQGVGGGLLQTVTEAKYKQPFELQKMQLQAYGQTGELYQEGMPNRAQGAFPTSWLLIGGALVLAVVLLKD